MWITIPLKVTRVPKIPDHCTLYGHIAGMNSHQCVIIVVTKNIYREHDKGPEVFCAVLMKLFEADKPFRVSFLGSHTSDIPG